MKYYFVLDFYCQTDAGLKKDKKESCVQNIDPWEDMEEDCGFIKEYLLPQIYLKPIDYILFKYKSKYILRFCCEAKTDLNSFIKSNKASITRLVQNGWSPFSLKGIPFKILELPNENTWKDFFTEPVEFNKNNIKQSRIFSFNYL